MAAEKLAEELGSGTSLEKIAQDCLRGRPLLTANLPGLSLGRTRLPPARRGVRLAQADWRECLKPRHRLDADLWFSTSSIFTSGLDPSYVSALLEVAHLF